MSSRHFGRTSRIAGIAVLGLGIGLALSACNSGTSSAAGAASSGVSATGAPSASAPTGAGQTNSASPVATAAPAVTPTSAPSAALVPMQTASGGEFVSPSGNISCEVDYHRVGLSQVYCQTGTPARSVKLSVTGKYTTCTGEQCLGNAGTGTPVLAYGKTTGVGPFRCESASAGVTCVADGKGFRISTSGITAVSLLLK